MKLEKHNKVSEKVGVMEFGLKITKKLMHDIYYYRRWRRRLCFQVCWFICFSDKVWMDFDNMLWKGHRKNTIEFCWRSKSSESKIFLSAYILQIVLSSLFAMWRNWSRKK